MKKNIAVSVVLIVIGILLSGCTNLLKKYEYLKEPQIMTMADQKMLVVTVQGDPNSQAKKAFGALFGMFFSMKKMQKDLNFGAPRSRWDLSADAPKDQWKGTYAVPISGNVTETSYSDKATGLEVKVETWKYGEVAEILHVGAYGDETKTVQKLMDFVRSKGYKVIGQHEEEYIKGPGMIFKGNPKNYLTIIRYRIEK